MAGQAGRRDMGPENLGRMERRFIVWALTASVLERNPKSVKRFSERLRDKAKT